MYGFLRQFAKVALETAKYSRGSLLAYRQRMNFRHRLVQR